MIKTGREVPKQPKVETDKEKIQRLENEVDSLKLAMDDLILNSMGGAL